MIVSDFGEFDERTVRYLDGTIDAESFAQLQDGLRASGEFRRRFLDHCIAAQECAEVTDARGIDKAVAAAPAKPSTTAGSTSPGWWRRNAAAFAAAAAAIAVLAVGVSDWRAGGFGPSAPAISQVEPLIPASRAGTFELVPIHLVRVSLVDRPPARFRLTPVASTAAAWWLAHGAELPPEPVSPSENDWLDRIELEVVDFQPADLDDIQL